MTMQKGKDLLVKVDQEGDFVTVAGLRAKRLTFNHDKLDLANAETLDKWGELLANSDLERVGISGSGIFKDAQSDDLVRGMFFSSDIKEWQFTVPDFGNLCGKFQITALEYSGQHGGEITFEAAMESCGPVQFTSCG
ncbi:phage major tail protein, TP901-1 family [Lentilitoribacter sp. Alg239-R112]|uniref:phage major tail protein, TP901-1 family n=1 Tax=Lentilitoribacter sp. Alg239-R112 TaxID=2305987 RepID=UPI0013A6DEE6|nr:phage major tail protein, TP901-1 family [Lentilitoribacter sp. Alg239-R112]